MFPRKHWLHLSVLATSLTIFSLLASLGLPNAASAQSIEVSDSFTGSGPLDGRPAEVGGVIWTAREGTVLSGGTVLDEAAVAGVPIDPASLPGNPTLTVSADVDPKDSNSVSVGFSSDAIIAYQVAGQLFVRLRSDGTYLVFADGSFLPSGTIPGTPVGGFHHVEVQYKSANTTASVRINGIEVFADFLVASPDIHYAGFHMSGGAASATKLDNFEVQTKTGVLISDTFLGTEPLDGRTTEVGGATWVARRAALLLGGVVLDAAAIAGGPINPLSLPGSPTVTVSADVDQSDSNGVSVGFSSQAKVAYQTVGQLFVRLRSDGRYVVFAGGSPLSEGIIPGIPVGGFHHVEVHYDAAGNDASIRINGTEVFSEVLVVTPNIQYAGFHIQGGRSTTKLDNFLLVAGESP